MSAFVLLCHYHLPDFLPPLAGFSAGLAGAGVAAVTVVFVFAIHNYLHPGISNSTNIWYKIYIDVIW